MKTVTTKSERETAELGRALAQSLRANAVILLFGDLGAGKTAFVKGMAAGLGVDPSNVTSPTFTLVQEYRGGRLPIFHVDLYRLKPIEVEDLGLDELVWDGGVTAIEWPDRLPRALRGAISVRITHGEADLRTLSIDSPGSPKA